MHTGINISWILGVIFHQYVRWNTFWYWCNIQTDVRNWYWPTLGWHVWHIILVCCQYDCLFDISEIIVQYCPDVTDTLLLHQNRYILLILELYWADIHTILIGLHRIASIIASLWHYSNIWPMLPPCYANVACILLKHGKVVFLCNYAWCL